MASVAVQESPNAGRVVTTNDQHHPLDPLEAQIFCKAVGMNPNATHEFEIPDINFLQEIARLPVNFTKIPNGTDVRLMRRWIDEVFLRGPLAEYRARINIKRRRPITKVDVQDVSVLCSGTSRESFGIRVYNPRLVERESKIHSRPAVLMFHGGGWIHGNPLGDENISTIFASELCAVVFSVDYRLAPEYPFPAPLDDCCQALEWVIQKAPDYGIDTDRIALWGASAGGNLAAAVALKLSQTRPLTEDRPLRLVSLVVPVTAHPKAQALFEEQRVVKKSQSEEAITELYTANSSDICHPLISPLMAHPNPQHPATHITVAACDYLMAQGLAYAQLLRSFGVEVTEDILPGVPHGFTFAVNAEVTKAWLERQVDLFAAVFESRSA
ncbi:uncharacterized protein Z518_11155 [Rhinocladiella mackenziei CBS 650.93]|uniref:Alpha/beta hydrolase fold-3 domain-containing protein n=1 Tax=Rhinocladiella mackenziei CBS 650.93 TaxID=1442369 RepID=A0A0D2GMZ4_9EURO|nr:uncharacterized protein Z518_11155 [Rhinocladiella mackenziei CBS 650.93]KIW99742.1 hypothetical protein Z518_11155 [Rhinocladiella mackenziei CBS 650.93]